MEACAAEAVVVVLLLLCSDNRGDRYFRKLPFSGFLVASFFDTHASTVFFCGFFGLFFIFYKIVLPRTHLVQVHRCTVHPERNDAPPGKRATGPACIPSPTTTTLASIVCVGGGGLTPPRSCFVVAPAPPPCVHACELAGPVPLWSPAAVHWFTPFCFRPPPPLPHTLGIANPGCCLRPTFGRVEGCAAGSCHTPCVGYRGGNCWHHIKVQGSGGAGHLPSAVSHTLARSLQKGAYATCLWDLSLLRFP